MSTTRKPARVVGGGGEIAAVGREGQVRDGVGPGAQGDAAEPRPGGAVEEIDLGAAVPRDPGIAADRDRLARGRQRDGVEPAFGPRADEAAQGRNESAVRSRPDARGLVVADRDDLPVGGIDREPVDGRAMHPGLDAQVGRRRDRVGVRPRRQRQGKDQKPQRRESGGCAAPTHEPGLGLRPPRAAQARAAGG